MRGSDGQAPSEPAAADGAGKPAGEPAEERTGERAERASGARPAALLERGVRDPIVMLGGALILASLVLKAYVLRQAYFIEDDFLFVADAAAHNLTVEYLTDLHKGHLMPGAKLLAYIQTAISPYNWGLTCGVMMLFQAGAAIGLSGCCGCCSAAAGRSSRRWRCSCSPRSPCRCWPGGRRR